MVATPIVLTDVLGHMLRLGMTDALQRQLLGSAVLVGLLPQGVPLPWDLATQQMVVPTPAHVAERGLSLDMLCWKLGPVGLQKLLGLPVRAGRAPHCEVHLPLAEVSKEHAQFLVLEGRWAIRDAGSVNGTFVNSVRLAPREPVELKDWDSVSFGSLALRFLHSTVLMELLSRRPSS